MKKILLALSIFGVLAVSCKEEKKYCWVCSETYYYPDQPPYAAHSEFDTTIQCGETETTILNFASQHPAEVKNQYTKSEMICNK